MKRFDITRSVPFRIAALYAALFALSVLILFGFVYWSAARDLTAQLRRSIQYESDHLISLYQQQGWQALREEVSERARHGSLIGPFYRLRDANGRVSLGNLAVPKSMSGWKLVPKPLRPHEDDDDAYALVLAVPVGHGQLVVGRSYASVDELDEVFLHGLGWTLALTVALALLGGVLMSRSALYRVDTIVSIGNEIMEGNLDRRLPVTGSGDEIDRLAETINRMLGRIQALIEGLRQVTTDIAHDLRTPLGRLQQRLEAARQPEMGEEERAAVLERAVSETNEILETFGALLRIAQIETGARRGHFSQVDLTGLVRDIVDSFAPVAEGEQKEITLHGAQALTVEGDRGLLAQALVNLVENAIRHSPPHSRIEVALEAVEGVVMLTVSDNGPGIPEPEREKVLRRFYRLEKSRTTPGNGLGLAVVKAVADLHHASIELGDNKPGLRVVLGFPPEPMS